jgi:hypothetical protein
LNLLARSLLVWLGLFVLAFVNGALREVVMKAYLGIREPFAHQFSCITGILLWTLFCLLIWKKLSLSTFSEATLIGAEWFFLTMLVETFLLNRNLSWKEIFHTYDFTAGEFWGLVLIWIGIMPPFLFLLFSFLQKKGGTT